MATLRRWMRPQLELYEDIGMGNGKAYDEVKMVLTGGPMAPESALLRRIRANAKGETIVSIAVPIQAQQRHSRRADAHDPRWADRPHH